MALYNLVCAVSSTLGTGSVVTGAAVAGYNNWSGVPNGAVVSYGIREKNALGVLTQSEVGIGTWNAGTSTLSRDTVRSSTNGGAKINLSTGIAEVYITAHAEDFDHTRLLNIGSNTHTQIDAHIANTNNPHNVTAAQIGALTVESDPVFLASVAAGIDAGDIAFWDAKQAALGFTPLNPANNLSDVSSAGTARTNLGLGSLAVVNDAPSNGSTYGRKDGAWAVVSFTESDPIFSASVAAGIDAGDISSWDSKQAGDATLTSIAALGTAADKMLYTTGVDTWAEATLTTFARSILDDADASAVRSTIGAQASLGFTPVDSASPSWVDLTDGGATVLHTHTGFGDISGTGIVGQVAEFVTNTKTLQAAKLIGPTGAILTLVNANAKSITFPGSTSDTVAMLATANVYTVGGQMVDSTTNVIELRLQAHSTKTTGFMTFEKSDGTVRGGIDSLGRLFSYGNPAVTTNLFIGAAGNGTLTGGTNLIIGDAAANSLTTANGNVIVGARAMFYSTIAVANVAIGFESQYQQEGQANIAIGKSTLWSATGTYYCVAIGQQAQYSNVSAQYNIAIGVDALYSNSSGGNNVVIGSRAGVSILGQQNTLIGDQAGRLATGYENVFLGTESGYNSTGHNNVFLGVKSGGKQTSTSNLVIIDGFGMRTNAAEEITNALIVGVNASAPASQTLRLNAVTSVKPNSALTNALSTQFIVGHNSTGTPAANFGLTQAFQLETTTTEDTNAASIDVLWVTATHASRAAKMSISAYDTAKRLGIEIEASGSAVKLGFFGGTTAIRQVLNAYTTDAESGAYTGAADGEAKLADLNALRVAYENLRASYDDLRTKLITSTLVA